MSGDRPARRGSNGAITVITPLKRWGAPWLRVQFQLTKMFPALRGLEPFKSVYYSQWCLVASIPYNGPPQVRERPPETYLLWEVAYSAETDPYIEAFAGVINRQIDRLWGSSFGFPGTRSVARLTDYIQAASWPAPVEYWACPHATVRTVLSSLEIAKEHAFLVQAAEKGTDEEFQAVYRGFLRRRAHDL